MDEDMVDSNASLTTVQVFTVQGTVYSSLHGGWLVNDDGAFAS